MRTFGEPPPDETPRPGAYAVVIDADWRVAVVRVQGQVFLPGGGIEPDETVDQAVHREVREETGLGIGDVSSLGAWHEYMIVDGKPIHRIAHYFTARATTRGEATDADHQLEWWLPSRARNELTLETERRIVRKALAAC